MFPTDAVSRDLFVLPFTHVLSVRACENFSDLVDPKIEPTLLAKSTVIAVGLAVEAAGAGGTTPCASAAWTVPARTERKREFFIEAKVCKWSSSV